MHDVIMSEYESPIQLMIHEIQEQREKAIWEQTYKILESYEIKVDKEELIKALSYDRKQYEKGYEDGYKDGKFDIVKSGKWENTDVTVWYAKDKASGQELELDIVAAKCSVCGIWCEQVNKFSSYMHYAYCPHCGAEMR